jgi:hypothetical protein
MQHTTTTEMTIDELRAVIKSLSIGCDQVSKKIDRLTDTKWQEGVTQEYALLMRAKHECERALVRAMEEIPNG